MKKHLKSLMEELIKYTKKYKRTGNASMLFIDAFPVFLGSIIRILHELILLKIEPLLNQQ